MLPSSLALSVANVRALFFELLFKLVAHVQRHQNVLHTFFLQVDDIAYHNTHELTAISTKNIINYYLNEWGAEIQRRLLATMKSTMNISMHMPPELWNSILLPYLTAHGLEPVIISKRRKCKIWKVTSMGKMYEIWDVDRLGKNYIRRHHGLIAAPDVVEVYVTEDYPASFKYSKGKLILRIVWQIKTAANYEERSAYGTFKL